MKKREILLDYNLGVFVDSDKYACALVSMTANQEYTLVIEEYEKILAFTNVGNDLDRILKLYPTTNQININKILDPTKIKLRHCFCEFVETRFNFEEGITLLKSLIGDRKLTLTESMVAELKYLNPKILNHRLNALILALTDFDESSVNPMIGT